MNKKLCEHYLKFQKRFFYTNTWLLFSGKYLGCGHILLHISQYINILNYILSEFFKTIGAHAPRER